ncbi:MAG: hypothetical protein OXU69_01075 [Gemmatimonadota bacterium]|nr:hypothetical protein [Gemmatimonadota bacterium]MDE2983267.1 hypothetical protein [Gemmatimonadota bacterium]
MASAQDRPRDEDAERFQLFASCSPVFPMVVLEQHSSYADDLEQAELEQIVLDGLESAGLLRDREGPPMLFISVGVIQWAFSVRVELMKSVNDPFTELRGGATTWRAHRYGIHSGDKSFVLSSLSTALNGFVDEYRRVNERACPSDTDRADAQRRPNGADR